VSDRYRRSPRVLHRNAGPDVLVVSRDADGLTTLSGASAVIWEVLSRPADADRIRTLVGDVLGTPPAAVATGIDDCLQELTAAGVIEREGSAT
jgi:hypothetical protein